jgi:glycosyltransferase involved in cell wall biosynthesis
MKLLIITQKVDKDDPILGFFHGWIEEFSKKFKSIVVICLFKNKYDLPGNVAVLSLGKEKWRSKLKYIFLLFYFSLRYFNRYDAVFVHMNEEYVVLAGWLWRLMGKKVFMWRNHHAGNTMTDIASMFCNKVFCTSKYSYTAKFKKTVLMPVGIDTTKFKADNSKSRSKNSILFLGRIAKTKNIDIFIEALGILKNRGFVFSTDIYGDALLKDMQYYEGLKSRATELGLNGLLKFYSGVPNYKTPEIYNNHEIYVNLSSSGMYDKTIFEAMTCGCLVLASNDNLKGQIDGCFIIEKREAKEVADKLESVISIKDNEKKIIALANMKFAETQSLSNLSSKLIQIM